MRKSDWNAFNVQYTHPNINCTSPRFRELVCFNKIAKNAFHETRNKCKKKKTKCSKLVKEKRDCRRDPASQT